MCKRKKTPLRCLFSFRAGDGDDGFARNLACARLARHPYGLFACAQSPQGWLATLTGFSLALKVLNSFHGLCPRKNLVLAICLRYAASRQPFGLALTAFVSSHNLSLRTSCMSQIMRFAASLRSCARLAPHPCGPLAMRREFLNNSYALRASRCLVGPSSRVLVQVTT